jgi:hypothetical protein
MSDRTTVMRDLFGVLYGPAREVVSLNDIDNPTNRPGGEAYQSYLDLVNVGRKTKIMTTTVPNSKTIDQKTPTRMAVIQVLTTSAWITGSEAVKLLEKFGYKSSTSKLRGSLTRMFRKSYVEGQRRLGDKHGRREWKLTAVGLQLSVNGTPPAKIKIPTGSKGSQGKQATMCIDPSKTTLNAAIASVVSDLIITGKTFSAHEVTKDLRERVANGNIVIDTKETGVVHIQSGEVAKVEHDYIRDAVHELFHQGKMTGYVRNHNGNYWTYAPAPAASPDPDPTSTPSDPSTSTPPAASGSYDGSSTL